MIFWKIKLRTLLLTGFLFTLIISSGLIISFTYAKYSKAIHRISLDTIDLASNRLYEKIGCVLQEIETLPELEAFFFKRYPGIDLNNTTLMTFFLGILKHTPRLYASYAGLPDGSYLIAIDLTMSNVGTLIFQPLPKDAAYVVLMRSPSNPNTHQVRAFFDQNCTLLSTKESATDFNVRTRPWYVGAEKATDLYWTDPYSNFYLQGEESLSVSEPFYDESGRLTWILGADLSFDLFSKFLEEQQPVSKHGKAYILGTQGKILLPKEEKSEKQKEIVSAAFHAFEKENASNFSYVFKNETYLASIHPFPTTYNKHWSIVFIAPLSDFFADLITTQQNAVLISLAVMAAALLLATLISIHISKPIVQIGHEIDRITRLDLDSTTRISSHIEEIKGIDTSVASMRNALRSFAHYVPKELAKQLMRKEHEIALGGVKKTISIFFTDIANFTSIAETLPIEKVSALLTEYFEVLTQVILSCGGTIDKYIGDSIMSIWGAPDDLPDFPARACTAALLCHTRLAALHEKRKNEEMPLFETRMGIKTGPAFVGNFGTAERMNYSAIGDAVNTAARLQALNKIYGTHIIIGEETVKAAGSQFLVRPLELVEVRGKKEKLKIYELAAQIDGAPEIRPDPETVELCTLFTQAYDLYEKGDLAGAKKAFQAIHKKFPGDPPTNLYLERLS